MSARPRVETHRGRKQSPTGQNVSPVSDRGQSDFFRGFIEADQYQGAQALTSGHRSCGCETTSIGGSEGSGPGDDPGVIADGDPDRGVAETPGFGCVSAGEEDPFGGRRKEPDRKSSVLEYRCLSGVTGMDEQTRGRKTATLLRPGAEFLMLYRCPGDVPAVSAEGRDLREGIFVAWSSAYLRHGAFECGDADRVLAAGFRAQQFGADKAVCTLNRQNPGGGILSGHGSDRREGEEWRREPS